MPQRVIIEPFKVAGMGPHSKGFEPDPNSMIAKALADGWNIVRTSSAMVDGLSALYVTFVLEKQEVGDSKAPYKGLL